MPIKYNAAWLTVTLKRSCVITFQEQETKADTLLLQPVRRLARLLDETMGPGNDEGTLQQTGRRRVQVQHVWSNAAIRPWALSEKADTYNSRQEVDVGLETWARSGPSFLKVYKKIQTNYPIAKQSLSTYYKKRFLLPKEKAQNLAEWVLDIALRSHYVFPNGRDSFRYNNVNTNPWKDH
ncbi:MAG TPA: hypothetical protein VM532_08475 [Burkholderiales bacterium]|nr:hypothetical protein [Burkholderiales bacterium]